MYLINGHRRLFRIHEDSLLLRRAASRQLKARKMNHVERAPLYELRIRRLVTTHQSRYPEIGCCV